MMIYHLILVYAASYFQTDIFPLLKMEPLIIKRGDSMRIINLIDNINMKIACNEPNEKLWKQYSYVVDLVSRLRNTSLPTQLEEFTCLDDFLDNHYENAFKVSELTKMLKNLCDLKKTKNDIENELVDSQKYKMINKHNVPYIMKK